MVPSSEIGWLEKILQAHIGNLFPGQAPQEDAVGGEALLCSALTAPELTTGEQAALEEWEEGLHSHRSVGDLLLEARINAAVRQQAEAMAHSLGLAETPEVPPIQVVRGSKEHSGVDLAASLTAAGLLEESDAGLSVLRLSSANTLVFTDRDGIDGIRGLSLDPNRTDFVEEGAEPDLEEARKPLTVVQSMHGLGVVEQAIKQALPRYQELVNKTPEELEERDLTGEVLGGKYRIKRLLGKGGFGSVYEAVDEMLGAPVAIKVLNPKAAGHDGALVQFLGEAKLLTNLDHPNIVRWITFDKRRDGQHYFVMEYLEGEELSEILKREGRLAPERVLAMLLDILDALRAAHKLPDGSALYHLDLKPQNVFVVSGEPERIKVIDFGISQHVGAEAREGAGVSVMSAPDKPGQDLTATIASQMAPAVAGEAKSSVQRARGGTLLYASPEQCKHLSGRPDIESLDGRSDLYSVGIMAFQMLTGEMPFADLKTPLDAIDAHLNRPPRKPSDLKVDVPGKLADWIATSLAKNREDRFEGAEEAYAALDRIANPPSRWPWVAAAAGLVVVPAGIWFGLQKPLEPFQVEDADRLVHVGPQNRSVELGLSGLEAKGTEVSFWSEVKGGEPLLTDWNAELTDTGDLRLSAPGELAQSVDRQVYLRVTGNGKPQSSRAPLRVVYLGKDSWSLTGAAVQGLLEKALDPVDAELEIFVRAESAAIADVRVTYEADGASRSAVFDAAQSMGDDLLFTVALDEFTLEERGPAAFGITVRDSAGGRQSTRFVPRIEPAELDVQARLLGCVEQGADNYLINPAHQPVLSVEPNRLASTTVEVLDDSNQPLPVGIGNPAEGGRALDLSGLGEAISGSIVIRCDDSATTHHARPGRGRTSKTLRFRYVPNEPTVRLTSSREKIELEGAEGFVTNDPAFELVLQRDDVQVTVESVCTSRATGVEVMRERYDLHTALSRRVPMTLPEDGVYDIEAHLYRRGSDRPEDTEKTFVVLDRKARSARLAGPEATVLTQETAEAFAIDMHLTQPADALPIPIGVNWQLLRQGGRERSGTLPSLLASGERIVVSWETLEIDPATLQDGMYQLEIGGSDAAGNALTLEEAGFAFELARESPVVVPIRPPNLGRWTPREANRFEIVVDVRDPNGVAEVSCTVGPPDGARTEDIVFIAPQSGSQWRALVDLPREWSGSNLRIEVSACDESGVESTTPTRIEVGAETFELPRLASITLGRRADPGVPVPRMRLIEGTDYYIFGGQGDSVEKGTFIEYRADYGYFAGEREMSWRLKTVIESLYLDENEVTVAQYLAFVRAPGGYANSANWTPSVGPEESRRGSLEQVLRTLAGDLPVTGVDWYEASAYAQWLGKRLPRFEEWEYAVRGAESRPSSFARQETEPNKKELNYDRFGGDPWPVTRGMDVTPAPASIRNLCSNVSEWTIPYEARAGAGREGTYVVGANFEHSNGYFYNASPRPPTERSSSVGFRCAVTLERVWEIQGSLESPWRVSEE